MSGNGGAFVRMALITEGGYPYAHGDSAVWCDGLVRGMAAHEFEVYALSRSAGQESGGWCALPPQVELVRTAPLWGPPQQHGAVRGAGVRSRRDRRRFDEHFGELIGAVCATTGRPSGGAGAAADRFAHGLYGLAALAADCGDLSGALRSARALRRLEAACRAPDSLPEVRRVRVGELPAVARWLEQTLRPLSLDWYLDGYDEHVDGPEPGAVGDRRSGFGRVDLCHVVGGGSALLPGLLAKRAFGVPLLLTEYRMRLREHYLHSAGHAVAPAAVGPAVRALLGSLQRRLAYQGYRQASLVVSGNAHTRRWQEHCGAAPDRLRTVYPGMDPAPFAPAAPGGGAPRSASGPARTLVWIGRVEPARDLVSLLYAFAEVHRGEPDTRLLIAETGQWSVPSVGGVQAAAYRAHCTTLAAELFPEAAAGRGAEAAGPVSFQEVGGPGVPTPAAVCAAADVVVATGVTEGLPVPLVAAMLCGRPTVAVDAGAVREVLGGTGLVVPPRHPKALAEACLLLLRDPGRRARLGAAARARALERFTVARNTAAFEDICRELISRAPVSGRHPGGRTAPRPFARPPESVLPCAPRRVRGRSTGPATAGAVFPGGPSRTGGIRGFGGPVAAEGWGAARRPAAGGAAAPTEDGG